MKTYTIGDNTYTEAEAKAALTQMLNEIDEAGEVIKALGWTGRQAKIAALLRK